MAGIFITSVLYLILTLSAIFFLFYMYVKNIYTYFEKRAIPYDKPHFPFGSFYSSALLKKSFSQVLNDIYVKYKSNKIVGFYSFWKKQLLITDPEIIKKILVKDFDIFPDRGVYYNKIKDPLSAHLFALDGKEWKTLRAKTSPTFSSGKIKGMFPNIVQCSKAMIDYIDSLMSKKKKVDGSSIFSRYGLAVIADIAFGLDSDALKNQDSMFVKMAHRMMEPTWDRLLAFLLMFNDHIAKRLDATIVPKAVSEYFLGMVSETVKFRESNSVTRNDYLQLLIQLRESGLKDSDGKDWRFSDEEMAAQSFVFVLAGSETTSSTLSFCLYELAQNDKIQRCLAAEVDTVTSLTYEHVNSLPYLDMVIDETLRKYPPLGFLNRLCLRDYLVPGTDIVIGKDTQVYVSLQGLQNDPNLFQDPEKFKPERFSKENRDRIKPYTYMPFGEGPRYCIGKRFALVTVKIALVNILRRFTVRLSPEVPIPAKIEPKTIVSLPAGGMWLIFEPRSSCQSTVDQK